MNIESVWKKTEFYVYIYILCLKTQKFITEIYHFYNDSNKFLSNLQISSTI